MATESYEAPSEYDRMNARERAFALFTECEEARRNGYNGETGHQAALARWNDWADFDSATFKGDASFFSATFKGDASFGSATFKDYASFYSATFKGNASFMSATFKDNAGFAQSTFDSHADFSHGEFLAAADFTALHASRAFNLAGVKFHCQVPQFTQAHFTESPRLDHLELPVPEMASREMPSPLPATPFEDGWHLAESSGGWPVIQRKLDLLEENEAIGEEEDGETWCARPLEFNDKKYRIRMREYIPAASLPGKPVDQDDVAAFTALRRLALKGEDHETERMAFKGEMRTMRVLSPWWSPFKWFSYAYDLLTGFGSSFMRPLFLWILLLVGSSVFYLGQAEKPDSPWFSQISVGCGTPAAHATLLSLRNGLLFATAGQRPYVQKAYTCLYGEKNNKPKLPQGLGLLGTMQTVLSAILIFFILLALRNRFKIK